MYITRKAKAKFCVCNHDQATAHLARSYSALGARGNTRETIVDGLICAGPNLSSRRLFTKVVESQIFLVPEAQALYAWNAVSQKLDGVGSVAAPMQIGGACMAV